MILSLKEMRYIQRSLFILSYSDVKDYFFRHGSKSRMIDADYYDWDEDNPKIKNLFNKYRFIS